MNAHFKHVKRYFVSSLLKYTPNKISSVRKNYYSVISTRLRPVQSSYTT